MYPKIWDQPKIDRAFLEAVKNLTSIDKRFSKVGRGETRFAREAVDIRAGTPHHGMVRLHYSGETSWRTLRRERALAPMASSH
jgi:hypothetical protein